MNELVNLVCQKTGVSEDIARKAVDVVLGFVKTRLPANMSGQLDALIATGQGGGIADTLKKAAGSLGGLLGKE